MRIGLITGEFPPMQGGVGAFTERLAEALADLDHEVHVITHREARAKPKQGNGISLSQLRKPEKTDWGLLHPVARRWRWADVGTIAQIALRYDLEVLNLQYQAAAFNMRSPAINLAPWRLRGIARVVTTFHDLRVPYLFPKAGRLRHWVVRLAARKSSGVIATNEEDRQVLRRWITDDRRVAQIPIGSNIRFHDVGEEEIAHVRRQLDLPEDTFLLGYFGFLNRSKGADLLLEALSQLAGNVHLVFIGGPTGSSDHENNQRFVDAINEQGQTLGVAERIHWTGFLPDRELSTMLQAADLMVMPYRDGASLRRGTLMAALAHGRPVVTTKPQRPIQELNHATNIWLVEGDEAASVAEAVGHLQHDDAMRLKLASNALQLSGQFGWDNIALQTAHFFERLRS